VNIKASDTHTAAPSETLSTLVMLRTYARWRDDLERRETWPEIVGRYVDFLREERPQVPANVYDAIHAAILAREVMPSMRALWAAGPSMKRDNTAGYNCAFLPLDCSQSFAEMLYILMMGTGCGYSVEAEFTGRLPVVGHPTGTTLVHVVGDTAEGWADSVYAAMEAGFAGDAVAFDYSHVRPQGAILRTKGGRASGPAPLQRLHEFIAATLAGASGRKLRPIECSDIACTVADVVVSGGVRRSATIACSDVDDAEMRHAKDWSRGEYPRVRAMANLSAIYHGRPTREVFEREWAALVQSQSGERGILNVAPMEAKRGHAIRLNPCAEVGLRFALADSPSCRVSGGGQFCNLSAAVLRASDTVETASRKVAVAAWIGAIQSTFTFYPYLRQTWQDMGKADRLVGVDLTGQCDAPHIANDAETLLTLNQVARDAADHMADLLGINRPAAVTCGKPSGNSSVMLDCAAGFHPRYAPSYLRRVRISAADPLCEVLRRSGVELVPEVNQGGGSGIPVSTLVASFPIASPPGSMTRHDETALEQLDRYRRIMETWCGTRGHNQSATVYVGDDEWDDVREWVWEHFDTVTGLSFLPRDGGAYPLAPYEEIDEATYLRLAAEVPDVDWSILAEVEREDMTEGAQALACTGGSCELV